MSRVSAARFAPAVLGLCAGLLALGPGLGRGYILRYDMAITPNPPLSPRVFGAGDTLPREVPSDAVLGLLDRMLPGGADVVQALVLLGGFVLAAAGVGRLVPGPWLVPRLVAVAYYVWNPFVAERLLLGQWAMLAGYAGLPWVLAAAAVLVPPTGRGARSWGRRAAGMVVALIPAAVGGFSAVVLSGLVAAAVVVTRPLRRMLPALAVLAGALAAVSLPWLVPALGSVAAAGVRTDPTAVALFAARADTPFGVVASVFSLGGVWNAQAVPVAFADPGLALGRLLLAAAAVAGWVYLLRGGGVRRIGPGLSLASGVGFVLALLGTVDAGRAVLQALIGIWPGFGVLRDGQLYVAPLALAQALGLGGVALWLRGWSQHQPAGRRGDDRTVAGRGHGFDRPTRRGAPDSRVGALAGVGLILLPVVFLPGLAWGAWGRLEPVTYPADWYTVQQRVDADPRPGALVSLPWSAYRGLEWDSGLGQTVRVVLDPVRKLVQRPVVADDTLRVEMDGEPHHARGEDPWSRRVAPLVEDGWPMERGGPAASTAAELGEHGVRYLVVDPQAAQDYPGTVELPDSAAEENEFWSAVPDTELVHHGEDLVLLRIDDDRVRAEHNRLSGLEVTGWLVMVGITFWSLAVSSSILGFRMLSGPGGKSRKESPAC
ncbi:hypothetical protein [Lipingzhangella rawalii]|uniref:hypothetical protein n=1 Tax=Lipingzhangella rawalii TaxID=2055835 RepID=UPI00287B6877|nr:hypothetical protein [Lipingzhangella rawalii]